MKIKSVELCKDEFAAYGRIMSRHEASEFNQLGAGDEYTFTDTTEDFEIGPRGCSGMLWCRNRKMTVNKMEHHKHTVEILVAINNDYILCVAPGNTAAPELDKIKAFRIKQGTVILMEKSCWHWIPFPLNDEDAQIMVIFKDKTGVEDLVFADLPEAVEIEE